MTDLYSRILLWHKLLAMQTGGLALCSARHRLNRDEARGWIDAARNVADDIEAFLETGAFILDDRGMRVVDYAIDNAVAEMAREAQHVATQPKSHADLSTATGCKAGSRRIATRKKT